ncbi:MAG TPA: ABC transporter substrate-binding protein [Candidatus Binatia bacterium]|jgi:NitT/TauT family transport system substrate-binding protein|nr:ABC transporter substrate-binding protein [Candidatus Binatia bacterium]
MKRVILCATLVLALGSMGGRRAAAQITTLHIGFNGFYGAAPLYVAQDSGIFRKQGLALELIFIAGGSLSTQALIGKSLDLLQTGGPPFLNAYLRGAKLKIIGGVTNILPYVLITGSHIISAEQLRGKKIGISRFGSNTDFVVRLALKHLGLTPSDVTILQVGGSQSRLVALKAGTIDATVLSPEEAMAAQKLGLNPLLDFVAKGVEFPHVNMVAREEYLQTQAPLVKRFMAAYVQGIRFFKTHKEEAVRKMMMLSKLNDREIAEKAFEVYSRSLPDDGRPTMKGLESVVADFAREDPKAKGLTLAQIVDLSFLP